MGDEHKIRRTEQRRSFMKIVGGTLVVGSGSMAGCTGDGSSNTEGSSGGDSTTQGGSGDSNDDTASPTETASLEEKAKEEGQVKLGRETTGLTTYWENFQEETGIQVDDQRRGDFIPQLLTEVTANNVTFDVWMDAGLHTMESKKQISQQFPEDHIPTSAHSIESRHIVRPYIRRGIGLQYNKENVSSPPSTFEELVSGDWEVVVQTNEPGHLVALREMHGEERANEMVRQLGEVAITSESKMNTSRQIARGERDIGFTFEKYMYYDHGDPLAMANVEGVPQTAAAEYMGVPEQAPRPNAGKFAVANFLEDAVGYMNDAVGDVFLSPEKEDSLNEGLDREVFFINASDHAGLDWEQIQSDWTSLLGA